MRLLMITGALSKIQCVELRGIYLQNMAEMEYNIHCFVFINVLSPENKNHCFSFSQSELFLSTEGVGPLHRVHHVAQPCFYSGPEGSNKMLDLRRAFFCNYFFCNLIAPVASPAPLEGEGYWREI